MYQIIRYISENLCLAGELKLFISIYKHSFDSKRHQLKSGLNLNLFYMPNKNQILESFFKWQSWH